MAGKEIMKIAYGIDVQDKDDEYISTAERAVQVISATTNAGSYLVDALPLCKHSAHLAPLKNLKLSTFSEIRTGMVSGSKLSERS